MMQEEKCERCGRVVSASELAVWTETERNRVFSGLNASRDAPVNDRPVFSYVHEDHAYHVCARCFADLSAGAPFGAPAQKRSITALVVVILLIAGAAALTPFILPTLMSAFWRT